MSRSLALTALLCSSAALLCATPATATETPRRGPSASRPAPVITVVARVMAVRPMNRGKHIRSQLELRTQAGRTIKLMIAAGRRGKYELRSTRWPRLSKGMRIRAQLTRVDAIWRLSRAIALGGRAAWQKYGCCTFPASRLPVHFATDPGLPDWALGPILAGVGWWTADGWSHMELSWDGPIGRGDFDVCGEGRSYVSFDDVRARFGGAVGVAFYCADSEGIFEFHALVDAYVDYSLVQVTAHEVGHGIGLDHSPDPSAVMYFESNGVGALHGDDLAGLRALYPGSHALDVRPASVDPLTYGSTRDVDVPVRAVGGAACNPAEMRLRLTEVSPPLVVSGPAVGGDGTVSLQPDPGDARRCHARFTVGLSSPSGGATTLRLTPIVSGASRQIYIPLNNAPDPAFEVVPLSPTTGIPFSLLSRSFDVDGDAITESWDLDGDGTYGDWYGPSAVTTLSAGEHTVGLRVSDGWSTSTTTQDVLVVQPPTIPEPTAPTAPTTPAVVPGGTPATTVPSGTQKPNTGTGRPTSKPGTWDRSIPLAFRGSRTLSVNAPRLRLVGEPDLYVDIALRVSKRTARRLGLRSTLVAKRALFLRKGVTSVRLRLPKRLRQLPARSHLGARLTVTSSAGEAVRRNVRLMR